MNDILVQVLISIIGGFILSNITLIIFQVVSYHPYSKPIVPIFFQSISVFLGLVILILIDGYEISLSSQWVSELESSLILGITDIMRILPLFYVLMLYFLFRASTCTQPTRTQPHLARHQIPCISLPPTLVA